MSPNHNLPCRDAVLDARAKHNRARTRLTPFPRLTCPTTVGDLVRLADAVHEDDVLLLLPAVFRKVEELAIVEDDQGAYPAGPDRARHAGQPGDFRGLRRAERCRRCDLTDEGNEEMNKKLDLSEGERVVAEGNHALTVDHDGNEVFCGLSLAETVEYLDLARNGSKGDPARADRYLELNEKHEAFRLRFTGAYKV